MSREYYCIFAGGGVRGTAYLGTLKVLEEKNIKVTGLAGSSVGSIFAALYAVGYTYEEMKSLLLNLNFEIFKDLYIPLGRDFSKFGLCKGDNFLCWMKQVLESKFYGIENPENRPSLKFKDLDKDLVIIATSLSNTNYKEYSKRKTPDVEVAQAIRASISIPGFFKPVWDGDDYLIDGDVIKNFPLWAFSSNLLPENKKILEFRLECNECPRKIKSPMDYFNAVLDTSYNISTEFLVNNYSLNDQFDFIKIDTDTIKPTDFHIGIEQKNMLIENGIKFTEKYFEEDLANKEKKLIKIYKELKNILEKVYIDISKNKIRSSRENISDLTLFTIKNKPYVHGMIYDRIIESVDLYTENYIKSKFLMTERLEHKEIVQKSFEGSIKKIQARIDEIVVYLDQIITVDLTAV